MNPRDWLKYEPQGDDYVPMEKWGKDHWSTLAYLETRVVDHNGKIDNRNMRCNPRLHRELANIGYGGLIDGSGYPTRLRDGETIDRHDDWSCVEDMAAAGLLEAEFRAHTASEVFGCNEARVRLTERGYAVASALRQHKARGKNFASFQYTESVAA